MGVTIRTRKRKNGRKVKFYEAAFYRNGKYVGSKSFPTNAAAASWLEEMENSEVTRQGPTLKTFSECVEGYFQSDFQKLRKSSRQARESRMRYFQDTPIDCIYVKDLSAQNIDQWISWLHSRPTVRNKNRITFKEEFKLFKQVLTWYREYYDEKYVLPVVKRHTKNLVVREKPPRPADYYMKPEEVTPWLDHLEFRRPDPVYYFLGMFMVTTSWRIGEACGLCWDAVNLESINPTAEVVRTLCWDYKTKEPYFQNMAKTKSSIRPVNLPPVLVTVLSHIKKARPFGLDKDPVFINKKGRLLSDNTVRDNFNEAFSACGLQWSGTHIARHTSGTLGLIATKDLPSVQALMGHRNVNQTEQYAKIVALMDNKVPHGIAEVIKLSSRMNSRTVLGYDS